MKKEQSVYNKLHKFSAKEEPIEIELAIDPMQIVGRLRQRFNQYASILEDLIPETKKEILQNANRANASFLRQELDKSTKSFNDFERQIKEIGINPNKVDGYKEWQRALDETAMLLKELDSVEQRLKKAANSI